ncbi:c-type cytochrome [Rhabdothermincola salaria]|uniref:c-type cytochrome n=1 Tax=Rhabdothermincola salaria TaxID=2903142 RepID=UPI001E3F1A5B|nr:cytochrome c [Rhabdothermincola salaria]
MTEVPEHLLKRSQDRRAALGLGGGGDGGGGGDAAPAAAAPADEPAPGSAVAPAAPSAAAKPAAATPAEVAPPEPPPPYVQAALTRKKIPFWAMPVLAFLPVWAIIYVGGLSPADTGEAGPLDQGAEIYAAQCASCHGGGGGGGVGRAFTDGELLATFPDISEMLEFVWVGSNGIGPAGTPYGDPDRAGGAHTTLSYNGNPMPAFQDVLTPEELLNVVRYEREVLGGEEVPAEEIGDADQRFWPDGAPIVDDAGQLVTPEGEALFDEEGFLTIEPNYG